MLNGHTSMWAIFESIWMAQLSAAASSQPDEDCLLVLLGQVEGASTAFCTDPSLPLRLVYDVYGFGSL